jgi:geranylgeranyl reductase family protein
MTRQRYDVVIVGAGPAGSAAAITLGRRGYAVAILDKERFPREKLCGNFINPSNWPTLRQLDVESEIRAAASDRVDRFRITSNFGAEAEVALPSRNGELAGGVSLPRAALDAILLARAQRLNAIPLEQHKIKSLRRVRDGWSLVTESPAGLNELSAKVVIGADGRNSWVAHNQGLVRSGATRGRAVGFQFRVKSRYDIAGKVEIHLFPGGYVGLLGLGQNLINFCFVVDKQCLERSGSLDALLASCVQQNPNLKELLRTSERAGIVRSTYPVYFPPRRCHADGLLLVGDAARVSEPVTGEGIYFALRSGVLAGDALHAALRRGDLSAAGLRRYAQACRRAFGLRRGLNALIRYSMYRPWLLSPFVRFSAKRQRLLDSLVHVLCLPEIQEQSAKGLTCDL